MAGKVGRRIYKSKRWRVVRLVVFRRDGYRCVKCGRRSGLECDHVRSIENAGDWFDLGNLRTLCRGCHIEVTRAENRRKLSEPRNIFRAMALGADDASPDQREQLQA